MSNSNHAHLTAGKTPVASYIKAPIITHLNDDHLDEIILFAKTLAKPAVTDVAHNTQISLTDIFNEGLLLKIETHDGFQSYRFINFIDDANSATVITNLEDAKKAYVQLVQTATKKAGKPSIKIQQRQFKLLKSDYVSPNMLRLHCIAPDDAPLDQPGYAYLFDLVNVEKASGIQTSAQAELAETEDLNSKEAIEKNFTKQRVQCYYTLRKAWKQDGQNRAWVDVYIHGNTPGGNWATALDTDDTIFSLREYPESIEHLQSGQCLIIADETSLPTVAWLLEQWQNPIAPAVIVITNGKDDIGYYDDINLPDALRSSLHRQANSAPLLQHIVRKTDVDLPNEILNILKNHPEFTQLTYQKVWGALESSDAKQLRKQLGELLSLSRQDMIIKTYWRKTINHR